MRDIEELSTMIRCPYCDAEPGQWCVTRTGNGALYAHGKRSEPIRIAYWAGHEDAKREQRKATR